MQNRRHRVRAHRLEVPTVFLGIAIYGGWAATTLLWRQLPVPLLVIAGGWFIAWHASLQHEVIHGHPTGSRRINDAIGWPPLSLWLPYAIYRQSHLRHHNDEMLTDPIEDPESAYLTPERWRRIGPVGRLVLRFDTTLLGRLLIGPFIMVGTFLASEVGRLVGGDRRHWRAWAAHAVGVAAVVAWARWACGMPVWVYLAAFVYPGAALTRLRSYAEHRWSESAAHRSALVERAGPFGLLFLNNNLHALHHAAPTVPWYSLPDLHWRERKRLIRQNGGLVYEGYLEIASRYLFRPHDRPVHPRRISAESGQTRAE